MAHRLLHSVLIATLLVLIAAPAALASADARGAGGAPGKGGQPAAKGHKDNRLTA